MKRPAIVVNVNARLDVLLVFIERVFLVNVIFAFAPEMTAGFIVGARAPKDQRSALRKLGNCHYRILPIKGPPPNKRPSLFSAPETLKKIPFLPIID